MVYRQTSRLARYEGRVADLTQVVRIIGFEALGNTDEFQTATLELRLKQNGKCASSKQEPPFAET